MNRRTTIDITNNLIKLNYSEDKEERWNSIPIYKEGNKFIYLRQQGELRSQKTLENTLNDVQYSIVTKNDTEMQKEY